MRSVHDRAENDNSSRIKIDELVGLLEQLLRERGDERRFGDVETLLLDAANEAIRRVLERKLQQSADGFAREVRIDGLLYRRHQPGSATYFSLCGSLQIRRWTYRAVGERNGATRVPVELWAGLVEGATPALGFSLAQGYAKAPIRSVEQDLRAAHRKPPSRSTLDRLAKAIGTKVTRCDERIENVIRRNERIPQEAVAINLGIDRTTVPMEEFEAGKRVVRYRMAYVGTMCLTNLETKPLCTRRYAVPAHRGPQSVVRRMMADVRQALHDRPDLNLGVVQDGATELWHIIHDAFRDDAFLRKLPRRETYDFYHLMEYLARVLEVLAKNEAEKQALLARWRNSLLRSDSAVKQIDQWINRRGFSFRFGSPKRDAFIRVVGMYLLSPRYFRYASLKNLGLHKGSGVTEGACKSLITMRAKRSGQRWRPSGINAVLALKSLADSERLPSFWNIFSQRYLAQCEAA